MEVNIFILNDLSLLSYLGSDVVEENSFYFYSGKKLQIMISFPTNVHNTHPTKLRIFAATTKQSFRYNYAFTAVILSFNCLWTSKYYRDETFCIQVREIELCGGHEAF